eukprot:gene42768-29411_t
MAPPHRDDHAPERSQLLPTGGGVRRAYGAAVRAPGAELRTATTEPEHRRQQTLRSAAAAVLIAVVCVSVWRYGLSRVCGWFSDNWYICRLADYAATDGWGHIEWDPLFNEWWEVVHAGRSRAAAPRPSILILVAAVLRDRPADVAAFAASHFARPPENAIAYLRAHDVPHYVHGLVTALIRDRPSDVRRYAEAHFAPQQGRSGTQAVPTPATAPGEGKGGRHAEQIRPTTVSAA